MPIPIFLAACTTRCKPYSIKTAQMPKPNKRTLTLFLLFFFLSSCVPAWGTQTSPVFPTVSVLPTNSPFLPLDYTPPPTVTRAYTPTTTPVIETVWISPAIPPFLAEAARNSGLFVITEPEGADARLEVALNPADSTATWIYALVTPFPTLTDNVSFADIQSAWTGIGEGPFAGVPIWMDETTLAAFSALWGAPKPEAVHIEAAEQLLDLAWVDRPAWGIVPFESLNPRWKVLTVDGQSPIHNDFDPSTYPLQVSFTLQPPLANLPTSNRDPEKLTVLIMTGVTALVRSTAARMVTKGLTYPGEDVRDTFRAADLLHISNEVPFSENCPYPYPIQETLVFCSDPSYITLLEDIGTDIVELTGNHFQDYGSSATLLTIDMYDERGWVYFGGGRNLEDARKAALIENNGNKLAFIGCNPVGPDFSWATADTPGSAECDWEYMQSEVTRLRGEGYLPIVTFQHDEYYVLYPSRAQIADFRSMAEAGAVIVSGSQSHFPQYMEFFDTAYIHYGLGNLFFDQMDYPAVGTRREFADRHVFYDGQYISVELLTYMLEDYSRPRPMQEWERQQLLWDVFTAGGWAGE
jgi:hypothetical protein